jgi:hypothetical protein
VNEPIGSGQTSIIQGVDALTIAEKVLGWHWQSTFEPQVGAAEAIASKMQLVAQSGIWAVANGDIARMERNESDDFIVSFGRNSGAVKDFAQLAAWVGTSIAKNRE